MTTEPTKKNYKETLNLPQTPFPMEAKLVQNEPGRLKKWQEMDLYRKLMEARKDSPQWILHDGPPFANGDIHIGHVINKTLKDVVQRFRSMEGKQTPYVPGWDCHGLPIEHKIQEQLGPKLRDMAVSDVRKLCYDYAQKYATIQSKQFQRLGILGDWEHPYLTMTADYEASTLEVFAKFVEAGLVYKKLKPVPWSVQNQTALADAELEYKDVEDPSIFVEFPVTDAAKLAALFGIAHSDTAGTAVLQTQHSFFFLVWTTTPWTLPANLAIAVHPEVTYALVSYTRNGKDKFGVAAQDLVNTVFQRKGVERFEVLGTTTGKALIEAKLQYHHPFIDRTSPILPALYVTTTDGTGLVHTAPGHGEDDYNTGLNNGLPVYCPVLANGRFDETAPQFLQNKSVWEGNPLITEKLREFDHLFDEVKILHSYPHDWRSKKPVIQRATEQWFVAVDKAFSPAVGTEKPETFRFSIPSDFAQAGGVQDQIIAAIQRRGYDADTVFAVKLAIEEATINAIKHENKFDHNKSVNIEARVSSDRVEFTIGKQSQTFTRPGCSSQTIRSLALASIASDVAFIPDWGRARLNGMLESRPDWCISRQRAWGLPIPVFYNEKGEALLTPESVRAVARSFARHGSDAWFTQTPAQILEGYDPGPAFPKDQLRKEKDIFDVWFESGSSWHSVLVGRPGFKYPCDMYLEGSDQHRGWFQLSLLPALGCTGRPPYKQVLTHGFIVKPDGTKVSKSDKEYVTATKEIDTHGADLLRLWCCSVDYQNDIPTSPQVIREFGDKYRKIRNTLRYLLSNLYDYQPDTVGHGPTLPPSSLDAWALDQLNQLIAQVTEAYNAYQLHRAFRLLHDFCSVQISAVYGNAMKDRLYCEAPAAPLRRRCQFVMHQMVLALTKLLAPMIVFTADETWEHIPHKPADEASLPSVHLALLPKPLPLEVSAETRQQWEMLMALRETGLMQLDGIKKAAGMNKALEAEIVYTVRSEQEKAWLAAYGVDLEDMLGAGFHSIVVDAGAPAISIQAIDRREKYPACARSWKRRPDVGQDPTHPDLSARDAAAVKARA